MKRYNIVNNALGWLCFVIAAVTYLLTIEPTASFWDCPEFISQGAKLEVGHPPGNPIFMLTARFFVTIFGGDITNASVAVNSMSALLSAATILLLFWTITHLVRKIVVRDNAETVTLTQLVAIMGSGLCGALAYTWSDTFWFSAVEGEVYAFSSFCTALVFWLILKWENRADEPHSDRYLVLIAYVIGVSIAVHLLNLLCIPTIVLVFYYRKYKNITATGSLIALGVSVVIVALILFGLVPGFVKVAQGFELFFVNTCHMSYNMGVLIYAIVLLAVFIATVRAIYVSGNTVKVKALTLATLMLSGLTFMTDNTLIWIVLTIGAAVYLFGFCNPLPRRVLSIGVLSILVIFVGYSSYALLLIRASADTPMNQNAPDNVFALSSYLNREQYGKNPLFYGQVFAEQPDWKVAKDSNGNDVSYVEIDENGRPVTTVAETIMRDMNGSAIDNGKSTYAKIAKSSPEQRDEYVKECYTPEYEYSPDVKMLFTRMYSTDPSHIEGYKSWSGYINRDLYDLPSRVPASVLKEWIDRGYATNLELGAYLTSMEPIRTVEGSIAPTAYVWKPSFFDNISYFLNYQLNHMYWRYFMWNFAGRQNDIQGNNEPMWGNWISGIPFIDNKRLGDQSLLPEEYTTGNKGHNVFYMLPLLMGLIGLLWQSLAYHRNNPNRGIEQFWVVFFLFFMTGIAIVLYLNQTPGQPRERDYAFAGSFYAFAIWIGMGVAALSKIIEWLFSVAGLAKPETAAEGAADKKSAPKANAQAKPAVQKVLPEKLQLTAAVIAALAGILVPLQMVSQTWDDHDRSHRYTTRDFGQNYLNSLEPNAIIFTNGDNDTFPLWYSQEVEGVRTDVRVVNLSYLSTDWYANQLLHPYYDAAAVKMLAKPTDYAYDRLGWSYVVDNGSGSIKALDALKTFYDSEPDPRFSSRVKILETPDMYAPVDKDAMYKRFGIDPQSSDSLYKIPYLKDIPMPGLKGGFGLSRLLSQDIIANSINDNFERPVYFATTVPESFYLGMMPNMHMTGLAYQVTPFYNPPVSPMVEKAYENIVSKFRWGGLDDPKHASGLYLDETVRRMVSTVRNSMMQVSEDLISTGSLPASEFAVKWATDNGQPVPANRFDMARNLLNLMEEKLSVEAADYEGYSDMILAGHYLKLYTFTGNESDYQHAQALIDRSLKRYAAFVRWGASLNSFSYDQYGTASSIGRYNFVLFTAYKSMLELAKQMHEHPEKFDDINDVVTLASMTDANMRADIYPLLFVKGLSVDDFSEIADAYGSSNQAFIFRQGAELTDMFNRAGIDPVASAQQVMDANNVTAEQITKLIPMLNRK